MVDFGSGQVLDCNVNGSGFHSLNRDLRTTPGFSVQVTSLFQRGLLEAEGGDHSKQTYSNQYQVYIFSNNHGSQTLSDPKVDVPPA